MDVFQAVRQACNCIKSLNHQMLFGKRVWQMLRPEEVEMLVCGSPTLDLHELRKVTEYDEYRPDDRVIQ